MTHITFARGLERPVASLRPYDRNARTHTKRQIDQIARSIERFGFTNPVLIDGANNIIAGHGRVMAAKQLGIETVPVVRIDGMSKAERKAYIIADNRLAELAGWDEETLAAELSGILEIEPDFDLDMIGFDEGALAALIDGKDLVDSVVEEPDADAPAVSQRGDLWVLGKHRIICGDARNAADYARLMHGEKAQMVFTDPPYSLGDLERDAVADPRLLVLRGDQRTGLHRDRRAGAQHGQLRCGCDRQCLSLCRTRQHSHAQTARQDPRGYAAVRLCLRRRGPADRRG